MNASQTISRGAERTSEPLSGQPHLFLVLRCDLPLDGGIVELGHSFLLFRESIAADAPDLVDAKDLRAPAGGFATLSPTLAADLDQLVLVARSRVPILVRGETGTGKELIATAIHRV